jgi:molybdenum cofactor cytidylyltransferase
MSTIAIILAADSGSDFAGPKYLAPISGELMLQTVIRDAAAWPVDEVLVVLGADAAEIMESIDFTGTSVVIDSEWSEGSASPMRAALDFASRDSSIHRSIIARGDQPGIDAEVTRDLIAAAIESGADAVVPKYRYAVGWPVVLHFSLWEHLLGGEGALDLLGFVASHVSSVEEVWFDHLPPTTYTTSQDLSRSGK